MKITKRGGDVLVCGLGSYSLADTLECGQCFRFERVGDHYFGVVGGEVVRVGEPARGSLVFYETSERRVREELVPFFALDTDWDAVADGIIAKCDNQWLRDAAEQARGIAILRQDPWEALASFILSQNNNIPRIKKIIRALCASYSDVRSAHCPRGGSCTDCGACCTFPSPGVILRAPEKLAAAKMGFREKYLLAAAEWAASGKFCPDQLSALDDEGCEAALCAIPGVGKKVAACVMLYGLGRTRAFPIDVWVRRAIDEQIGPSFDPRVFGKYAGTAQQYIFHYARKNLTEGKDKTVSSM